MKGDFSNWRFDPHDNDQGVLFQQGRVMRDVDLTAGELIALNWKGQVGRDVIGKGIAAVSSAEPDSFKVVSAAVAGDTPPEVHLQILPGRLWADGLLVYLPEGSGGPGVPVDRIADYFTPQDSTQTPSVGDIGDGVRDAVVLEVNFEELNGFQNPERLIEPALGGPDTAERINARRALRLVRLGRNDTCDSIVADLQDNPAGKGKLSVSLQPPTDTSGDCPTVANGGYAGLEHNLYRIEIAQTNKPDLYFKWSQFNGGLVGRGEFHDDTSSKHCVIKANRTAIVNSGLTEFYLEALQFDVEHGYWRVVYGAQANLNSNNDIELTDIFGTLPATSGSDTVFFRLWNGLKKVSDFTNSTTPVELRDGIRLAFDTPASGNYRPGDYWTFIVRAGEIKNPQTLIDHLPPAGPRYHRVPLAEIDWSARKDTRLSGTIEDCRKRFRPLTNQKLCCSYLVGNGISSFGDFNSLEEAAAHLPATGGELCLLPGVHFANLKLEERMNVTVHGCARRTKVIPHRENATDPIIHIKGGSGFHMYDLDLVASFGEAVLIEASDKAPAKDVRIENCRMLARTYCVRINGAEDIVVARNRLWVLDTKQGMAAISLKATHALIERNRLGVWPFEMKPPPTRDGGGKTPDPADPCQTPEFLYDNIHYVLEYASLIWRKAILVPPKQPYNAQGGIHLIGSSANVRVLQNIIDGGAGHGITLGGLLPGESLPTSTSDGADSPGVDLAYPSMWGCTRDGSGKPLGEIEVFISRDGAPIAQGRSDGDGNFLIKLAQKGQYQLNVSPGWRITQLKKISEIEFGDEYILVLESAPVVKPDEIMPLNGITILENEILRMAMSGIGFRAFAQKTGTLLYRALSSPLRVVEYLTSTLIPRELLGVVNIVRDITIRGNRIHHNLRAVFDTALQKSVHSIGQGGISLGLTESVVISDNLIYENGGSTINPICGIFIGAGDDIQISTNRINGNGTVPNDYESARLEGPRGGIFVRFATAFSTEKAGDGIQKPALLIEGNRIDQPAGRAITAFAFGPVACVGNFLNSERAGRWNVLDSLVGTVLILDLGGIQRFLRQRLMIAVRSPTHGHSAYNSNSLFTSENHARRPIWTESVLPGGEVLFNSNQVRMGAQNRTFISQLLLTLDDAGYDGNQGSVFQPEVLLTNTLLLANTLRTTSNRWREETVDCHFSLLSVALSKAGTYAIGMNTCALNQGDHCIVPRAPAPGQLVKDNNLELDASICDAVRKKDNFKEYLYEGFSAAWAAQNAGSLNIEDPAVLVRTAFVNSLREVEILRVGYQHAYLEENTRLLKQLGADDPQVLRAIQRSTKNAEVLRELQIAGELADVPQQPAAGSGAVLGGRVADPADRGQPGLRVELVNQGNKPVGPSATTNASGYYVITLDQQTVETLAKGKTLQLQVRDTQGKVLQRSETPIQIEAGSTIHHIFTVPVRTVSPAAIAGATVIYRAPPVAVGGTPLENIKGIGPKTAAKLRAAGIPDVEAFLKTPDEKLVEIAGFDADVVKKQAEEAVKADAQATPAAASMDTTVKAKTPSPTKRAKTVKKASTRTRKKKK